MSGGRADLKEPVRTRWLVAALVAMIHVSVVLALIQAFAFDLAGKVTESLVATFDVGPAPSPSPTPTPPPRQPDEAGAAGEEGKQAVPREVAAPQPLIPLATQAAPPVAGSGTADSAGARDQGAGTGAGGQGNGTGTGGSGSGQGGGLARKFVQIAGTIDSAKDYPKATRDVRIGKSVLIVFTVGTDGRVHNCRVREPSGDAQSDAITCRLAEERFRFRPSLDDQGNPIEATYGWRQRWFYNTPQK